MKKGKWVWLLALVWLMGGCCSHPGVFKKVQSSLETVQDFYGPLLQGKGTQNEKMRQALVAADSALLLAGELQDRWCPNSQKAEQLELQTQEAQRLAQEAGVAKAGASQETSQGTVSGEQGK